MRGAAARADPIDQVREPDPAADAPIEPQRDALPGLGADGPLPDLAVERVRVAEAKGPLVRDVATADDADPGRAALPGHVPRLRASPRAVRLARLCRVALIADPSTWSNSTMSHSTDPWASAAAMAGP